MQRLIERRTRLAFETPFLIGKRPLIVTIKPWGLSLREKSCRSGSLEITWAQIWNRAAIVAADQKRAGLKGFIERRSKPKDRRSFQ